MKRFILVVLFLISLVGAGFAADELVNYQTFSRSGPTLYYQPSGTETHARYNIASDSITLTVVNTSTYTHVFQYSDANIATFALFQSSLTSMSGTDTQAMAGTWVFGIPETVSPQNGITALEEVFASSNCFTTANAKTLFIDVSSTTKMSFYPSARTGKKIKIKAAIANVTGTSPTITVYDKDAVALTPSASMTSGSALYFGLESTDMPIAIAPQGEAAEVRVETTAAMTAGWLMVAYTVE